MTARRYVMVGKVTAAISFAFGTIIFALFFFTASTQFLFLGYAFIVTVGLSNLIVLFLILRKANSDFENRRRLIQAIGVMLLNIPVMFLYCWIAMELLNIVRITLVNATSDKLTNIKVSGCETKQISALEVVRKKRFG